MVRCWRCGGRGYPPFCMGAGEIDPPEPPIKRDPLAARSGVGELVLLVLLRAEGEGSSGVATQHRMRGRAQDISRRR